MDQGDVHSQRHPFHSRSSLLRHRIRNSFLARWSWSFFMAIPHPHRYRYPQPIYIQRFPSTNSHWMESRPQGPHQFTMRRKYAHRYATRDIPQDNLNLQCGRISWSGPSTHTHTPSGSIATMSSMAPLMRSHKHYNSSPSRTKSQQLISLLTSSPLQNIFLTYPLLSDSTIPLFNLTNGSACARPAKPVSAFNWKTNNEHNTPFDNT